MIKQGMVQSLILAAAMGISLGGCGNSNTDDQIDCEVAIIGGGAGGLHTAYRLAPTLGSGVCVLEREDRLGGRIRDVAFDEKDPSAPRIGVGARRIMETQAVLFALATELGLKLESPPIEADLIGARGKFAFDKDSLRSQYPALKLDMDPDNDQETYLLNQLRKGPERARVTNYPDFRSYIRNVSGTEGYDFLRDMSRFRGDYESPLDARSYLDFLDEEWDVCCAASYPVGGMSEFIRGMENKATAQGARIFKSTTVTAINKSGNRFKISAGDRTVNATKVVLAIPPYYLNDVTGDVAERIKIQPQYQQIINVRVVTITQWWQDAWWTQIKNPTLPKDNQVWRAWTTDHCVTFTEIPLNPYAVAQKVTRSVYSDDLLCVQFWEELAKQGTARVEAEVQRGLTFMFNNNGVSMPATVAIPAPLKTFVQVWPDAWHWLRAGATFTNAEVFSWAAQPLPGEEVGLVGEAYNVQRAGWSDAAYKSSIKLLNTRYGMNLPGLQQALTVSQPGSRRTRSQGGR